MAIVPSAYPFSNTKLLERQRLAKEVGQEAADLYKRICLSEHGIEYDVSFNEALKEKIAASYKSKVQKFKYRNGFSLIERINQGKIAALFVEAILHVHDKADVGGEAFMFNIPESLRNTDFGDGLVYEMTWRALASILKLDLDKIPAECRRDFVLCIYRYKADSEWVAWACGNLCAAYGEPLNVGD